MRIESGAGDLRIYSRFPGRSPEEAAWEAQLVDEGSPAVFSYSWERPVVILGYGQAVADIDLDFCRRREIPVFRRVTGGTGVIHHRDLSLSLVLPAEHPWARGINTLYDAFLTVLESVLNESGAGVSRLKSPPSGSRRRSKICFEDQMADTLLREGKKVVGCAQLRRKNAVMIHAAISLHLKVELYASVFGVGSGRIRAGLGEALPGADPEVLGGRLVKALAQSLDLQAQPMPLPPLGKRWRQRYQEPRWFPLGSND